MSRNSDNRDIAGGVAAGLTLLGAAAGGLYALYKFSQSTHVEAQSASRPPSTPRPPSALGVGPATAPRPLYQRPQGPRGGDTTSRNCIICKKDLSAEKCCTLECDHKFHKLCIQANYLSKKGNDEDFHCPICKIPASEGKIQQLFY